MVLHGTTPASPDDRGEPDAALLAALAADDIPAALGRVLFARLLVPVVADPTEVGDAAMAIPALIGEAGARALPAFTGLDALHRWQPNARPVPMPGARVIAGAVAEGYTAVVLDVAGPIPLQLAGAVLARLNEAVAALGQG